MTDLDKQIQEALDAEERELFDQLGDQGLFSQWFSVYSGKQAWIAIMTTIVIFVLLGAAVYAGWNFLHANESTMEASHWGALTWFLMTMIAFMKVWFWMRMESNRVIREIKRVELQLVRLQAK